MEYAVACKYNGFEAHGRLKGSIPFRVTTNQKPFRKVVRWKVPLYLLTQNGNFNREPYTLQA